MSSLPTAPDRGYRATRVMLAALLSCYGLAALGAMGWPVMAAFIVFLAGSALLVPALRDVRVGVVVLVVAALVLVSLGSPGDGWDPRSIWLFHAKRIYLEGSLQAQLDGYASWSHNDYPALAPLLMASLAGLAGEWNELLPKAAAPLLLLPGLLVAASSLRSPWWVALFVLAVLRIGDVMLVNGYLDMPLAVYTVAAVVAGLRLRLPRPRWPDALLFALVAAVLSLLKNEGMVAAAVVTGAVLADGVVRDRRLYWPVAIAFVAALLPVLAWKLAVAGAQLDNDLTRSNLPAQLWARLTGGHGDALRVARQLLLHEWVLLPLLLLGVLGRRTLRTPAAVAAVLAALGYALVLFLVYLGTPHDLDWHLRTSAGRTILPVFLLLAHAACQVLDGFGQRPAGADGSGHARA